jgi:MarR family 2-MHQ and catechol resistance regulon transcriptional repressor
MQRDGLLKSERNPLNKRIVNVMLTDKGRETFAQIMPAAVKIVERVMTSITKDEAALLEKLLKTIRLNTQIGLEAICRNASPHNLCPG